jgi:hypothetical protein
VIQALKVGALYFAGVFAAGFLLGVIRTLWVEPGLGTRVAELMEAPIMLLVITFAARALVRRHVELAQGRLWLAAGVIALAILLGVELTVVLRLRGLSLSEYFATRDAVSGTVYCLLLIVFAVMPLVMFSRRGGSARPR